MKIILISLHNKLNEIEPRTLYTWVSLNNLILLSHVLTFLVEVLNRQPLSYMEVRMTT